MTATASRLASRAERVIGAVIDGVGAATAWVGLALVLVVAGNVLLRYVFNTGTVALQELEWHLVPPVALFGMAYGMRKGAHVRVDFLYDRLPLRATLVIDLIAALLMVAIATAVVTLALPYVGQSIELMEASPDPGGLPYRWVLKAFIPAGFVCFGLQAVAQALQCGLAIANLPATDTDAYAPNRTAEAAAAS